MSRLRVVDTEKDALRMFERFHDRPSKKRTEMPFTWPSRMQEVGEAQAQMYRSNKWKADLRDCEDYKHIAESFQTCYATPGFLRDYATGKELDIDGKYLELESPMPRHFSILAPLIGVQVRLNSGDLYEVVVPQGILAGAMHPKTKETFLFVYTKAAGVGLIITGDRLAVEKDGIVG